MSSPFRQVSVQPFSSVGDTTASSQTVEDNNAAVAAATAVQDTGVENRILLCVEVGRVAELAEKIRLGSAWPRLPRIRVVSSILRSLKFGIRKWSPKWRGSFPPPKFPITSRGLQRAYIDVRYQ